MSAAKRHPRPHWPAVHKQLAIRWPVGARASNPRYDKRASCLLTRLQGRIDADGIQDVILRSPEWLFTTLLHIYHIILYIS